MDECHPSLTLQLQLQYVVHVVQHVHTQLETGGGDEEEEEEEMDGMMRKNRKK